MANQFNEVIEKVIKHFPMQRKKLQKEFSSLGDDFYQEANAFIANFQRFLHTQNITLDDAIKSYVLMCKDMLKLQIAFSKTGQYPKDDGAVDALYEDRKSMTSYMVGLGLSQFLWRSHYQIFQFFKKHINAQGSLTNYLEIGPGHGLFFNQALESMPAEVKKTVLDLSPISLDITRSIIAFFKPEVQDIVYLNQDVLDFKNEGLYDFITMGEVLEHLDRPDLLLRKLNEMLAENGTAFISTCANCPAVDHKYHFKTLDEIRMMIIDHGFDIKDELFIPAEALPMEQIVQKKLTINYCAMLTKANS